MKKLIRNYDLSEYKARKLQKGSSFYSAPTPALPSPVGDRYRNLPTNPMSTNGFNKTSQSVKNLNKASSAAGSAAAANAAKNMKFGNQAMDYRRRMYEEQNKMNNANYASETMQWGGSLDKKAMSASAAGAIKPAMSMGRASTAYTAPQKRAQYRPQPSGNRTAGVSGIPATQAIAGSGDDMERRQYTAQERRAGVAANAMGRAVSSMQWGGPLDKKTIGDRAAGAMSQPAADSAGRDIANPRDYTAPQQRLQPGLPNMGGSSMKALEAIRARNAAKKAAADRNMQRRAAQEKPYMNSMASDAYNQTRDFQNGGMVRETPYTGQPRWKNNI